MTIAERAFSTADQEAFARWSGDCNPMHLDALAARRTSAGAPVVHGVHALLWALETASSDLPQGRFGIRADFRKFIYVGQPVSLKIASDRRGEPVLELTSEHGLVAKIRIRGAKDVPVEVPARPDLAVPARPQVPSFEDMRSSHGRLLPATIDGLADAFPRLGERLSVPSVVALAQVSALVGTICPGLHSILAALDLDFGLAVHDPAGVRFQTDLADERYRLVRMAVAGPGMAGTVEAFVRPEPVGAISFAEAARLVRPDQFANRRALIVGGSRGLGASSAKLLAAGGASVIVTYASGASEAAEICREIGGNCNAMPLDVTKPLAGQLATIAELPTHVYYFASPRIFLQKKPEFERSVFDRFLRFYVDAFAELCAWLTDRASTPVSVLYPSSIAVMERPAGLTEYAMAKAAGEILCADLMQLHANLVIQAPRLPRVLTDQTATVMIVESSSPESVLLPLLRG